MPGLEHRHVQLVHWRMEGTASAHYFDKPARFPDFTFPVTGGSAELGKSDKGRFTVHRIEGVGYNSGTFSGAAGIDYQASEREGTSVLRHIIALHFNPDTFSRTLPVQTGDGEFSR